MLNYGLQYKNIGKSVELKGVKLFKNGMITVSTANCESYSGGNANK